MKKLLFVILCSGLIYFSFLSGDTDAIQKYISQLQPEKLREILLHSPVMTFQDKEKYLIQMRTLLQKLKAFEQTGIWIEQDNASSPIFKSMHKNGLKGLLKVALGGWLVFAIAKSMHVTLIDGIDSQSITMAGISTIALVSVLGSALKDFTKTTSNYFCNDAYKKVYYIKALLEEAQA